jgi:hypothetical protein
MGGCWLENDVDPLDCCVPVLFFLLLVLFADPLRQSLSDGRTDRSKWPDWPHDGRRTMSALPAVQHCKLRKPGGIPPLKNGEDGVEVFLKNIMEPACR